MIESAVQLLVDAQNSDGGWGAIKGNRSNTENTAFAILGLNALRRKHLLRNIRAGLNWLIQRQQAEGSWPLNDASKESSWTTALAILSLCPFPEYREWSIRAARWLLQQEGRTPGILARIVLAVTSQRTGSDLNPELAGWPWVPKTFSWVEPTSYALLALKKLRALLGATEVNARIQQGELMIYDRMCEGGGWNYGNSKVLGESLWPYPDVTAVALIALQDRRQTQANQESLHALQKMMQDIDSGLALCWGTICLSIYGDDTSLWRSRIERCFHRTEFLGETKTIALSLIVFVDDATVFRV